jgi:drug/metabolite transporter (DMT)-like permease
VVGGWTQIAATAALLRVMAERNFTLGVAYSKTELVQVAIFGLLLLGDPLTLGSELAIGLATLAVLMLTPADKEHPVRSFLLGWTHRTALIGLLAGACFAVASVAYRGAALTLEGVGPFSSAAVTLVVAQVIQTISLGGWLLARNRTVVIKVFRAWRTSLLAGLAGAAASVGWFTAGAIEPVAHVRTLGLVELLFAYVVSRRLFTESLRPIEGAALMLLMAALVIVSLWR